MNVLCSVVSGIIAFWFLFAAGVALVIKGGGGLPLAVIAVGGSFAFSMISRRYWYFMRIERSLTFAAEAARVSEFVKRGYSSEVALGGLRPNYRVLKRGRGWSIKCGSCDIVDCDGDIMEIRLYVTKGEICGVDFSSTRDPKRIAKIIAAERREGGHRHQKGATDWLGRPM